MWPPPPSPGAAPAARRSRFRGAHRTKRAHRRQHFERQDRKARQHGAAARPRRRGRQAHHRRRRAADRGARHLVGHHAEGRADAVLRQPHEPRRLRAAVGHAAARPARTHAAGGGAGLLGSLEAAQLHRQGRVQRADDPARRLGPGRQPGRPDEGRAGGRRLAHHVPRGHSQHGRRHPATAEKRAVPPGARLPPRAAGAGVDREPEARAAQGRAGADSAGLHGALRHADHAGGRGREGVVPGPRAAMLDLRPEYDRLEPNSRQDGGTAA